MIQGWETETGLCGKCTHASIISNPKGSKFWLCNLSKVDPSYPKYPRLPVIHCDGYVKRENGKEAGRESV